MSYIKSAGFDEYDDIVFAKMAARLTTEQCIELCDISERTWHRWMRNGAPRWAIRLVESQIGKLDRFGWQDWEIRSGSLYCNQLHHRYHWTPARLILPLYNVNDPAVTYYQWADNLTSLQAARKSRDTAKTLDTKDKDASAVLSTAAHNIYYVKLSIRPHKYPQDRKRRDGTMPSCTRT